MKKQKGSTPAILNQVLMNNASIGNLKDVIDDEMDYELDDDKKAAREAKKNSENKNLEE